jgi:hypothetical protein
MQLQATSQSKFQLKDGGIKFAIEAFPIRFFSDLSRRVERLFLILSKLFCINTNFLTVLIMSPDADVRIKHGPSTRLKTRSAE